MDLISFPSLGPILVSLMSIFFFFGLINFVRNQFKTHKRNSRLPPGPWKLPLIGNLHNLSSFLPHHTLRDLAKKYGPLMHLQLGEISAVVVSSSKVAEQIMKKNDLSFAARPQNLTTEIMSYGNSSLIFCPYGNYWRQLRKIVTLELLSTKRVNSFRHIREDEVSKLIQKISSMAAPGLPINLSQQILSLTTDITCRAAFGNQCKDKEVFTSLMQEVIELSGGFDLGDLFPSLKFIHSSKAKLKSIHQKVDKILGDVIGDHRSRMITTSPMENDEREEDLVDVLIRLQEHGGLEFPITTDNIKCVISDIFTAGTETSATTLGWAMSEIIRNPRIMKKAQAEVREVLNGKRKIDETDIHKMEYLNLIVKETLRLHPPAPLLPRECRETCKIDEFEIPIKTKIIINAWAIGRDEKYWRDAAIFEPERFSTEPVDYKGTNFEFIPFGAGRRICPGISFGVANIELPLAQLLYNFDWEFLDGAKPEDLDMSELFGATVKRKTDLYLIPTPYHFSGLTH